MRFKSYLLKGFYTKKLLLMIYNYYSVSFFGTTVRMMFLWVYCNYWTESC